MVTQIYRLVGGAPKPLVRRAFQLASVQKLVTKPYVRLRNLDDAEFLAQLEAVDRFAANTIAYPGRTFGQLYHRMVRNNALKDGVIDINGHDIRTDAITLPVLVFAGNTDGIAPINSVRSLVRLLPNASEVRFEIVPGGHLGMLTGRAARGTTWRIMDEWISEHSTPDSGPTSPKQAPAKRMFAAARPAQTTTGGDPPAIGASPDRTYRSASSRGLARK
jgi:polyhydroxyalkanoate synthase subunit PhaC